MNNYVEKDAVFLKLSDDDKLKLRELKKKRIRNVPFFFSLSMVSLLGLSSIISHYSGTHFIIVIFLLAFISLIGAAIYTTMWTYFLPESLKTDIDSEEKDIYLRNGWDGKSFFILK